MKTIILLLILLSTVSSAQYSDTSGTKPIQYRRGIPLQEGYQSYSEKYAGKNLIEEKRRLFPVESTGVWTELNPKVPRVDYLGIHFVNPDTGLPAGQVGWAVGNLGTIIKSTNGGIDWITEETNTTTPILKVNSIDGQTVIASGFNGMILRSTNSGESWTQITSGVTGDLWGLQMINDTLGWACGTANSLIKTTDGGQTWQTEATPGYSSDYWWIDFLNENYGFIAANGKVLRTTNAGNTWDIVQAGDNQSLFSVAVIDSLHIAAAGYGGTGYRGKTVYSSDGGNTWITGGPTTYDPINCIKYVNPDTGYITMSEVGLWKTTDSGQSWTLLDLPLSNIGEFEIQLFKQENIGYNTGSGLKIYKADGDLDVWHKLIINDDFVDVFFPTEQKGFVISSGPRGRVYRTFDSGEHWQLAPGPSGYSLFFTDSLTGYLGSTSVWKTIDGGDSWYQTNSPNTYGEINEIEFINNQVGWEVTAGAAILKTSNAGEDWFTQFTGLSYPIFTGISFTDSLIGWVSGLGWQPYKTSDGGNSWIKQANLDFYNSNDIYFVNQDTGWIADADSYGALYKTTDSGISWSLISEVLSPHNFNFFPDPSHWIINGSHKYITTNNGNTWIEITNDVPTAFNKFQAPTDFVGYAAGNGGLILKYTDTLYTPVELSSFSANISDNNVLLNWITVTETNNQGFEIQRVGFRDQISEWAKIGYVSGNGTTILTHSYSFTDKNASPGKYIYRLKQIDFNGSYKYSKEVEVEIGATDKFSLEQNYPNPFNPETSISYTVSEETNVKIKLFDITGREIRVLVNEKKQPGYYTIKLKGGGLSSGVYFYRLTTGSGYSAVKKLMFLK